ncbi:ABC transporter [Venturia nashicola]|nr:ABC transporter [Venturia nashicola]
MRSSSLSTESISKAGSAPSHDERSPEDNLRLWQFLSVSWIAPLITIGNKQQVEESNVWLLGYQFQHRRLHEAFRVLRGTVTRRLFQANGIDVTILTLTAFIQLFCEFASPLLLQQLLKVMESESRRKQVAMIYALLLWATRVVSAQTSMLAMWYGRRCYERSRGEMIMMVYDKALSRKAVVGLDKKETTETSETNTSADAANGTADKPKKKRSAIFNLFKELLTGRSSTETKADGPASTGKILNIVRGDIYEVSQRFYDWETLLKAPVGLILAIVFIWRLMGPSSFLAILVVFSANVITAGLSKIQASWRQRKKKATDARLNANSQYIEVLRHLRWYSWQDSWLKNVMAARRHELDIKIVLMALNITIYFFNVLASTLFPVVAFAAYTVLAGQPLRIDIIFPALQLFNALQSRLREIPSLITTLVNAYVAMKRIEEFMSESEKEEALDLDSTEPQIASDIKLENVSFAWPGLQTPVLRDVNLTCEPGMTIIHGKVGTGKTALLLALLGELDMLGETGIADVPNQKISYCAQTPWLQSMSIRENILFFGQYEEERYQKVLDACELTTDLANFKSGDQSLIGENGIGLSGGQKARLALARAVYNKARVLLLDDPLSALDHNTAESIVEKLFSGPLVQDRIVVLVTHRTNLVRHLNAKFVEIADGIVSVDDTLMNQNDSGSSSEQQSDSGSTNVSEGVQSPKLKDNDATPDKWTEDEHRNYGGIQRKVWWSYFKSGRLSWWALLIVMIATMRFFGVAQQWFYKALGEAYNNKKINLWTLIQHGGSKLQDEWSISSSHGTTMMNSTSFLNPIDHFPSPNDNVKPWLSLLFLIGVATSVALFLYGIAQLAAAYCASVTLFNRAMIRVTHATFRFYDVTPTGRLMNRLTSDIQVVDTALHYFGHIIFSGSFWISSFIIIASVTPLFLLFSLVLMAIFIWIFFQFLPTSQSLRRLEKTSLSPLFANFGELLQPGGLTTVRSFHAQSLFQDRVISVLDSFQGYDHFYWSVQNWLSWRYENISAMSTFALTAIALSIDLSPGLTAFMLINANVFVTSTHTLCQRYGTLQMEFVSVERVIELTEIEQEDPGSVMPPASWPKFGANIEFDNVTVRYAPHLPPSLSDVSISIPGGSTTAIVGRTGSGKSTLASTLLSITRPETGSIHIDNHSLNNIDISTLRNRLTFVPQDPILFSGTIRHNLDPILQYTDTECLTVLRQVCKNQPHWDLTTLVESGGSNISQGQRQLIGIARAVLRRSSVVILDEATASIDHETAGEVQAVLREELKGATVVVIAHRVEAVRDAEFFVELDAGRVVRQGRVSEMGLLDGEGK